MADQIKESILLSACLGGLSCKYDGSTQNIEKFKEILPKLMEKYNVVMFCPEIAGGLSTPRNPSEIKGERVITNKGVDVTEQFKKGAREALYVAKLYNCRYAILKQRSPSCGSKMIYDGTFTGTVIQGDGITVRELKKAGITVFSEDEAYKLL